MTGVQSMFIEGGASVYFTCTSRTALKVAGEYDTVTQQGNFSVAEVDVKYDGKLLFTDQFDDDGRDMLVVIPDFEIKHRGLVIMRNRAIVNSKLIDLESAGKISLDGTGKLNILYPQ